MEHFRVAGTQTPKQKPDSPPGSPLGPCQSLPLPPTPRTQGPLSRRSAHAVFPVGELDRWLGAVWSRAREQDRSGQFTLKGRKWPAAQSGPLGLGRGLQGGDCPQDMTPCAGVAGTAVCPSPCWRRERGWSPGWAGSRSPLSSFESWAQQGPAGQTALDPGPPPLSKSPRPRTTGPQTLFPP